MFLRFLFRLPRITAYTQTTESSSIVPVVGGIGIWNLPSRPSVVFNLPDLPKSSLPARGGTPQGVGINGGPSAGGTGARGEGNGGVTGCNGGKGEITTRTKAQGTAEVAMRMTVATRTIVMAMPILRRPPRLHRARRVAHHPMSLVRPAQPHEQAR